MAILQPVQVYPAQVGGGLSHILKRVYEIRRRRFSYILSLILLYPLTCNRPRANPNLNTGVTVFYLPHVPLQLVYNYRSCYHRRASASTTYTTYKRKKPTVVTPNALAVDIYNVYNNGVVVAVLLLLLLLTATIIPLPLHYNTISYNDRTTAKEKQQPGK